MLRLTAIQEVNDDAAISSSRYRPPKVTTYPAIKSNPLGKSATRIKNPNESLDGSIFSPSKDVSADFVTLTSPKKSPYSSTGKDSGSRLSSNHQRNSNSQSSLNLYSPSYKSPMRSTSNSKFALNKTEILDIRETRQRPSYGDDHSLGIYVTQQMEASREDWGSINGIETKDQQSEDVKKLGAWQFEKVREKGIRVHCNLRKLIPIGPSQEDDNIIPSKYKSPSKSREDFTLPTINAKLVNMIMTSPDEERYKYQDTKKGLVSPSTSEGEFKKLNEFGEASVQSLQNAIRETNQGILLDMISRKIKDFFVKIDINTMNAEQLKLYTRSIAESVLDQFKALKGATNITKIQNRVEAVIGKLKKAKNPQDEMVRDIDVPTKRPKPVIDYKYQELNLLKSFHDSVLNIKNINDRLVFLNKQTLKLNTQIRLSIKQVYFYYIIFFSLQK